MIVKIIIGIQLMNGYELLNDNVDVIVGVKYIIILFYFDIFDIKNLM